MPPVASPPVVISSSPVQEKQQTLSKSLKCSAAGAVYETAANLRDQGQSPQFAYSILTPYGKAAIGSDGLKSIINQVYFARALAPYSGQQMASIGYHLCMGDLPTWHPLK